MSYDACAIVHATAHVHAAAIAPVYAIANGNVLASVSVYVLACHAASDSATAIAIASVNASAFVN